MKKSIYIVLLLIIFLMGYETKSQTITSVANGNWTDPATWGGVVPTLGSNVIINHVVTLNTDWYSNGNILINNIGSLNGNSSSRGLAVGSKLTVYGTLHIARVALYSGTISNSGIFQIDSLINRTFLINNSGATINAVHFQIGTNGTLNNNGTIVSTSLANINTVTNDGTISCYNLTNSKSFTNSTTGTINVSNNFLNTDSLASPGIFYNNGTVQVNNNWRNTDQVEGSGKFCIQNNTNNSGTMFGTFDFCDLSGGNIDINTGTIAGTITYCLYSCTIGIKENANNNLIKLYPNPSDGAFSIFIENTLPKVNVEIFNMLGERIYMQLLNKGKSDFNLSGQPKGIYIYQIKTDKEIINTGKIIIE
jgi:hypothetical protein